MVCWADFGEIGVSLLINFLNDMPRGTSHDQIGRCVSAVSPSLQKVRAWPMPMLPATERELCINPCITSVRLRRLGCTC